MTFVSDGPEQATSDHGWDVKANTDVLAPAVERMKALGIRASLFIDEDPAVPADAARIGADRVDCIRRPMVVQPDRSKAIATSLRLQQPLGQRGRWALRSMRDTT